MKSKCCSAPVKSVGGGDFSDDDDFGTYHWECESCGLPTDIQPVSFEDKVIESFIDNFCVMIERSQYSEEELEKVYNFIRQSLQEQREDIVQKITEITSNHFMTCDERLNNVDQFLNNLKSSGL